MLCSNEGCNNDPSYYSKKQDILLCEEHKNESTLLNFSNQNIDAVYVPGMKGTCDLLRYLSLLIDDFQEFVWEKYKGEKLEKVDEVIKEFCNEAKIIEGELDQAFYN